MSRRYLSTSINLTRPANTTAYAAKDAVSDSTSSPSVLTFSGALPANTGDFGKIVSARLVTSQSTNTALFKLHLYRTAPTPINDNAAYATLYANRSIRLGSIDFPALGTEGTGSDMALTMHKYVDIPFKIDPSVSNTSMNIYGMLETLSAFTPDSAQTFFIELMIEVE